MEDTGRERKFLAPKAGWKPARRRADILSALPFAVKENELPDPTPIGLLGAERIMPEAHDLPERVAQAQFGIGDQRLSATIGIGGWD